MRRVDRPGIACLLSILATLLIPSEPARCAPRRASLLPSTQRRTADFARQGAIRRLRSTECQRILTDFRDHRGRPLAENLASFAMTPDEYLARMPFLDGAGHGSCEEGAQLFATVGAARVFVCERFLSTVWQRRTAAEVYVIHEMLHTLGLGEDPPTSDAITWQVQRRCTP